MRHTIATAVAWLLLTAIVRAELPELIVLGHNRCTESRIAMTDLLSPAFQAELARECRVKFVGPVGEAYKRLNPKRLPAFYLDGQFLFDGYDGPTHLLQAVQKAKGDRAPIGGHTPPVTPAVAPPPPTSPAPPKAMPLDVGLRNRVAVLEERVQAMWEWPAPETIAGPAGPPGPPGKDGRPGPPGPAARTEPIASIAPPRRAWFLPEKFHPLHIVAGIVGLYLSGGVANIGWWSAGKAFEGIASMIARSRQSRTPSPRDGPAELPPSVRASEIKHLSNPTVEKLRFITIEDDRTMHVLNKAVEDYMNTHRQHKAVIAHFYKFFETKLEVTKGA